MPIISSELVSDSPQVDGRRRVNELHVSDAGEQFTFSYLADSSHDSEATLAARAAEISGQLAVKAAALAEVVGTVLPLSRLEFLSRFTVQERITIRAAAKDDPVVEDFLFMLDVAGNVIPAHPTTQQGLGYLVSLKLLTVERSQEIGA